ncbi:hypothetical protein LTR95_002381 [Oleoguttula sp. CCFEE 5521]
MRTTLSLAALAVAVPALAAGPPAYEPPAGYRGGRPHGGRPWGSASSVVSSTVSSSVSAGPYEYGNNTSSYGPTATGSYISPVSVSSSTPVAPVSYSSSSSVAPSPYTAETTKTYYTTIYATVCTDSGETGTTSLVVTAPATTAAAYQSGAVTETHTYIYTEDVITSTTGTSSGAPYTSTYHITRTLTTTVTATVYPSTSAAAQPTGYGSDSAVAPASEPTSAPMYGSITLTWATSSDTATTPPSYETSSGVVSGPATSVTSYTSTYPTTCTETITKTYGGNATSVITTTYTSTITSVISKTVTVSKTSSSSVRTGYTYPSASGYPHPTGGYPYPSGSGSPYPTGYTSGSGYPYPTGGPYPGGNSTTVGPTGTGALPTMTTSEEHSHPTEACIPCEGQPGTLDNFCGLDINTNYYKEIPKTCRTVTYDLVVSNITFAPDGVERMGLVINGVMPGPLIEANWGDTIVVHVTNEMQNNGTALHFHGMRQYYTNEMDGVPSITQCALAPGQSMTYKFVAGNYGSSWYHSHHVLQTYDGVFGPMIIHGPHSAPYDIDVGAVMLQDWSHDPVEAIFARPSSNGPITLDTGLINGLNVFNSTGGAQIGKRFELTFQPGKKYLLRLVNGAIQTTFKFHIDGHSFTVISNDYVPIVPYKTDIVNINIGQRYDVIVEANAPPGNYWMRSDAQQACATLVNSRDIKAVVHYAGFTGLPTSVSKTYKDECVDEPYGSLVPVVALNAGKESKEIHKTVLIGPGPQTPNLFKWTLDGTTFQSQWGNPTLEQIYENGTIPTYSGNLAIEVPKLGEWVYLIIESPIPVPHPIHLHGHDFFIIAQGAGPYSSAVPMNLVNPPRRDVANMPWQAAGPAGPPLGGYLVIAFETDNPGAWLIGWHSTMGFALQIIENVEGIKATVKAPEQLEDTCSSWNTYAGLTNKKTPYDSGI